jgi:hypothetical protein
MNIFPCIGRALDVSHSNLTATGIDAFTLLTQLRY